MGRFASLLVVLGACGRVGFDEPPVTPPAECMLALDAGAPRLNFNSTRAVQAAGGADPIVWSLTGDGATIDQHGIVHAGTSASTVTIEAVDAGDCTAQATLAIGGDTLWYVGGSSMSVPSANVYKSTDGIAWTQAGVLPDKRTSGALYVFHDQLFYAAGSNAQQENEVYASSDGATWTMVGRVPVAVANPGYAVFDDRMWLVGGAGTSADQDQVYWSDDGATWNAAGTLPDDNHGGALIANDKLWYVGGHNNNNGMLYKWALSTSDGTTWSQPGSMLTGREYAGAIAVGDTLVIAGGQDLTPTPTRSVVTTTDGITFTQAAQLPLARAHTALVQFNGTIFSIGGSDGMGVYTLAAISGMSWMTPTTTFPVPRQAGRVAVFTPM